MSHSGGDNFSDVEEEGYNAEFRSYPDDAWYSVRVSLEGELGDKLRVKYENFTDDHDNVYLAESFKSKDELYDFIGRFRKVLHKKHSNVNEQEECECTFLLFWLHGPHVGNVTDKVVADICLLQVSELQPKLASFMEIALRKIEKAFCQSVSGAGVDLACNIVDEHRDTKGSPIVKRKPSFAELWRQRECAQRALSALWPSEEVHCASRQDTDVGGDKNRYIILVQNLEKELSSSTVSEFIHKQTSIAVRVYIFPSLPWEPYTNGAIMLDCQKDLEQLFGFLQNPNHFIVSLNGRTNSSTEGVLHLAAMN